MKKQLVVIDPKVYNEILLSLGKLKVRSGLENATKYVDIYNKLQTGQMMNIDVKEEE